MLHMMINQSNKIKSNKSKHWNEKSLLVSFDFSNKACIYVPKTSNIVAN